MITLIIGPMFSGKTTQLLAYERRFIIAKKSFIIIKYKGDTRYSESKVVNHDGKCNLCDHVYHLTNLADMDAYVLNQVDCVLIDEGQFFLDLEWFCKKYSKNKHIVISGLSGDYQQKPFASISNVLGLADNIQHYVSICSKCGKDAAFTARISSENEQTVIGGSDKYQPRCGECFDLS